MWRRGSLSTLQLLIPWFVSSWCWTILSNFFLKQSLSIAFAKLIQLSDIHLSMPRFWACLELRLTGRDTKRETKIIVVVETSENFLILPIEGTFWFVSTLCTLVCTPEEIWSSWPYWFGQFPFWWCYCPRLKFGAKRITFLSGNRVWL